jgi:cysteine synthase A
MSQSTPPAVPGVLATVGRTPLVRLAAFERAGGPRLFAKLEFLGPGGSIFDRAVVAEFAAGGQAGHLSAGRHLIAAGGTDASLSLAMAASATGHPLTLLVPRSLMPERRRALLDYGARLENVEDTAGLEAARELALVRARDADAHVIDLFSGPAIVRSYESIGRELVASLGTTPTLTLCGLDLGAIPTGIARGLSGGAVVAVEPDAARIGSGGPFGPHLQLGLAPGPVAVVLDRTLVNDFEAVTDTEAWQRAEALSMRTGILAGLVSGAVLTAALRRALPLGSNDIIVAVLPDSGERRFMLAPFLA